ncbi:MAG TPA: trypsin-like peptidase domain-containing protein [Candidatus Kapabacteria bacterium]
MTTRQTLVTLSLLAIPLSASAQNDKLNGKIYSEAKPVSIKTADSLSNSITGTRRNAITRAVEKVSPAVVGINVTEIREQRYNDPYGSMFNDPMFRQFFGNRGGGGRVQKYQVQGLGSGFIISSDGYILTNDHVAGNASKIIITTVGGKQYDARLIATDAVSDVALLKIDAENLPYLHLGSSEDLAVGEWAIAMGNPFGLFRTNDKPTVTVGVISNTGVNLGIENGKNFRDMIQTDAAISSGNSGGPLLNANGDVIGVNATIYSTTQGNQGAGSIGLGFAIPINKIKGILNDFKSGKKIDRNIGNLGFMGQTLNDELKEYIGIKADEGVVITNLYRNSVGERAGLQPGDLIIGIDEDKVRTFEDLQSIIADKKVGDVVKFNVLRSEGQFTATIKLPPNTR